MAQKITPNLWFDGNAREAAEFYISVLPDSRITGDSKYPNSAEEGLADFQQHLAGQDLTVNFSLSGYNFVAINAGPEFKFNPAISFMLNFDPSRDEQAAQHLDEIWNKLIEGGEALMELGEYPFSKRYGWVKDKFGLTWQLILTDPEGEPRPFIIPSLQFGGSAQNRAAEAIDFYVKLFKNSRKGGQYTYGQPTGPAGADNLMFADFQLENQWFTANDSGVEQDFSFIEAVSLQVDCEDQAEIDYFWDNLTADGGEESVCGWCKDKFGVSWQVVPVNMGELMSRPGAFAKMMEMKKLIIDDF